MKGFRVSIGVLGVVFIAVFWFCWVDYRNVTKEVRVLHSQQHERVLRVRIVDEKRLKKKEEEEGRDEFSGIIDGCDVFDGDWVWDRSYPLYKSKECRFLDQGFRCSENGRPDFFYTKWRWQPTNCNLPRFNGKMMLEKLRNKRVVFAGDSIGRNQWESLLCLLSSAVSKNKGSVYEVNGNPITKHKGFLVFRFRDYNLTVEYYRAPFLVLQSRPPPESPRNVTTTLKLDRMDWMAPSWKDADVIVLNTGHWWNYEKTIRGGCYFQQGSDLKMEMSIEAAYKKALDTVFKWILLEVNTDNTQVFFRSYAPVHFRGGSWRSGGACHRETLPQIGSSSIVPPQTWTIYTVFNELRRSAFTNSSPFEVLNITEMTARRKDGHPSLYYLGRRQSGRHASIHRQDCSHWCLPGVPDAWNEILYALLLKNHRRINNRSTDSSSFYS